MSGYGPNSGRQPLGVRGPANWLPPATWRTRFVALEDDFEKGGPLCREFTRIREIAERSDWQAQEATTDLVLAHPALFGLPTEFQHGARPACNTCRNRLSRTAGFNLAWSIVCGTKLPNPEAFTGDAPPYRTEHRRRGTNRSTARTYPAEERTHRMLDLLRTGHTYAQVAGLLGLDPKHLFSEIARLRRGGVVLHNAREQTWRAGILEEIKAHNRRTRDDLRRDADPDQRTPTSPPAARTASPEITKCMYCGATFAGTPEERRAAFDQHRASEHIPPN